MKILAAVLTVAMLLGGCSSGEPAGDRDSTPTASPSPSPSGSPAASPTPTAGPSVTPTQGGAYWAVYLAAGDPTSDAFKAKLKVLEEKGLPHSPGDVNCDEGAAEALAISDEEFVVGVYFATEQDARTYAALLPIEPAGIARVTTRCLD